MNYIPRHDASINRNSSTRTLPDLSSVVPTGSERDFENVDIEANAKEIRRWHPKISPFRLLTLTLGAGLGVLKAVLMYNGPEFGSVAVEWIIGTVLFLIFYFLSLLEQDGRSTGVSHRWFFDYDCMLLVWKLVRQWNVEPPEYSTSEVSIRESNRHPQEVVTNYRILVSLVILVFGILKATLTYLGHADGATAVDWIFGVVITTGLYILGLYEYNTAKVLPSLFAQNNSQIVIFVGYEGGILVFVTLLTTLFVIGTRLAWDLAVMVQKRHDNDASDIKTLGRFTNQSTDILVYTSLAFFGYVSLLPLMAAIFTIRRYFQPSGLVLGLVRTFMHRSGLSRYSPRYYVSRQEVYAWGYFSFTATNHMILHLLALMYMIFGSILCFTMSLVLLPKTAFVAVFLSVVALIIAAGIIPVFNSMVRPFARMRQIGLRRARARPGFIMFD